MLYLIVNPSSKSGFGKRCLDELIQKLNKNHILFEVEYTDRHKGVKPGIAKFLKQMKDDPDGKPVLGVLGGDGTMNGVVSELKKQDETILEDGRVAIAYLPTGSSNDLARSVGLKANVDDFINRYLLYKNKKSSPKMDFGYLKMNGKKAYYSVSCGMGFDAAVCQDVQVSSAKKILNSIGLGKLSYGLIAIKTVLTSKLTSMDVTLDDGTVHHFEKVLFAVSMIQPYEGGGIKMTPKADCHDGKLDVMVASDLKRFQAFYLLPLAFFGLHVNAKQVHIFKTKYAKIESVDSLTVHTDGEPCGNVKKIEVGCVKDGMTFL